MWAFSYGQQVGKDGVMMNSKVNNGESGPNGLVTVTPKKFKFLQGGLVTGAGAMEGVDCVRCTSMI
ncbi:hypothetical protein YC2023_067569 [Brassica napus]